ncbi:MAG: LLM class F420-dependent oxidoreductase [Acidimicrobiales bacterium]
MDLRIFTEPQQGATYEDLLAVALTSESAGFSGFFRSDHYLKMGDVSGFPGPSHAWVTLAGLARETRTIRLGTLVSPVTFYRPGPLAIAVAQVDAMSGGRVEFGFGAGWYEAEHSAYGLDFPPLGDRFDRYEESLEQIRGLWSTPEGKTYSHDGTFHRFVDSPALPKPIQKPGPPIIIGGRGPKRTPALVARYAAEFNLPFTPIEQIRPAIERVEAACETIGRNPGEIVKSAALVLCVGGSEAEVRRRAAAIGRSAEELRADGAAGLVEEVVDRLGAYADEGITRMYLQVLDLGDLDHVSMAGSDVIPAVADR